MKFEIKTDYDDSKKFYIDGEEISYANHDRDGWHGIDKLTEMFEAVATKIGVEILYTDGE